jgi:hypothetical protein
MEPRARMGVYLGNTDDGTTGPINTYVIYLPSTDVITTTRDLVINETVFGYTGNYTNWFQTADPGKVVNLQDIYSTADLDEHKRKFETFEQEHYAESMENRSFNRENELQKNSSAKTFSQDNMNNMDLDEIEQFAQLTFDEFADSEIVNQHNKVDFFAGDIDGPSTSIWEIGANGRSGTCTAVSGLSIGESNAREVLSALIAMKKDGVKTKVGRANNSTQRTMSKKKGFYNAPISDTPSSYLQAISPQFVTKWNSAIEKELKSLSDQAVFTDALKLPTGRKALATRWLFAIKRDTVRGDTYKARLIARGNNMIHMVDYYATYAPTSTKDGFRLLICLTTLYNLTTFQLDIKTAFLNGIMEDEVYVVPPEGWPNWKQLRRDNKVLRLNKALYGTKQAPRMWYKVLKEVMLKSNFKSSYYDPGIFYKWTNDKFILVIIYVDDIFGCGNDIDGIEKLKEFIGINFNYTNLGEIGLYLGMRVERAPTQTVLHQQAYIQEIVTEFGLDNAKHEKYPYAADLKLDQNLNTDIICPDRLQRYQSLIGKLLYLIQCSRLDIAFVVTQLSRYTRDPSDYHMKAALHVLRYLRSTSQLGLIYYTAKNPDIIEPVLVGLTDSDYANDRDSKSISGGIAQLINAPENTEEDVINGNTLIFQSSKQDCVTLSTTEAEYVAANKAAKSLMWMRNLLIEIGFPQPAPTVLFGDNVASIFMTEAEHHSQRSRHVEQRFNWIKMVVEDKKLVMHHRLGTTLTADFLTKNLTGTLFYKHRKTVSGK